MLRRVMTVIAPLRPLRYAVANLATVVAPPYDVISAADRAELVARDPHNVARLILPDGEGDTRYANAAALLAAWRAEGVLVRDETPSFYRYDQTFAPPGGGAKRRRRGLLALVRTAPYADRVVLPHERTLAGPKEDRLKLFRATRTNLSPGFMLYRDPARAIDAAIATGVPFAAFRTPDGVDHELARIAEPDAVRAIVDHMAKGSLLIADGHHRYETALRYAGETDAALAAAGTPAGPRAEHRFFMAFLCNGDDPDLVVFPTHRFVHSLAGFSFGEFVQRAASLFRVTPASADPASLVAELRDLGRSGTAFAAVAPGGRAVLLALRSDVDLAAHPTLGARPAVVRRTDVAVLHGGVLEHLLGISLEAQAAKTNLSYLQDPADGVRRLETGEGQVLFVMNATPVAQVREVAEAGEVMPQKSTYFYPKVLTGLAIHTLEPDREV